jgi:hypothetical protein
MLQISVAWTFLYIFMFYFGKVGFFSQHVLFSYPRYCQFVQRLKCSESAVNFHEEGMSCQPLPISRVSFLEGGAFAEALK